MLLRAGVVTQRGYWDKGTADGAKCAGRLVAIMLRNLADHEAVARQIARRGRP